jgi:hypothetical protein
VIEQAKKKKRLDPKHLPNVDETTEEAIIQELREQVSLNIK